MPIMVPTFQPSKGVSLNAGTPGKIDTGGSMVAETLAEQGEAGRKMAVELLEQRKTAENKNYVDTTMAEYGIERAKMENQLEREHDGKSGAGYYKAMYEFDKSWKEKKLADAPNPAARYALQAYSEDATKVTLINAENTQNKFFNTFMAAKPDKISDEYAKKITEAPIGSVLTLGETALNQALTTTTTANEIGALSSKAKEAKDKSIGDLLSTVVANRAERDLNFDLAVKTVGSPFMWGKLLDEKIDKMKEQGDPRAFALEKAREKYGPQLWGNKLWKESNLAKWYPAEKKEQTIRAFYHGLVVRESAESDSLQLEIENQKEANDNLTHSGDILSDSSNKLIERVKLKDSWDNKKKAHEIAKIQFSKLTGETRKVMTLMPERVARQMLDELKHVQFTSLPEEGKVNYINTMKEKYGLSSNIFNLLRMDPTVGTKAYLELTNGLETWYNGYRSSLKENPADGLKKYNPELAKVWDELETNPPSDPQWFTLNKDKLLRAITYTKILGEAADIPGNRMNFIPEKHLDTLLTSLNSMAEQGRYEDANYSIEELKKAVSDGSSTLDVTGKLTPNVAAQLRMWKDLAKRDDSDAWGPELGVIAQYPISDRAELLRQQTPASIQATEDLLGKDYPMTDFTNVIADNPQWQKFKATMLATGNQDDKEFAANMEKVLGRALANKFVLNKSKMSVKDKERTEKMDAKNFALSQAGESQAIIDKYVNRHWTAIETGSGSIRVSNEVLNTLSQKLTPEAKHKFDTDTSIRKNMVQIAEVVARRSAMVDPGFVVPPDIDAQYIKMDEEFKKTIPWYDRRFATPEGRRYEYIMNTHVVTDDNGGLKFMVNDKAHPSYNFNLDGTKTPSQSSYMISWDSVVADPDFSEGVMKASNKSDWWKWMFRDREYALELINKSKKRQIEHKTNIDEKAQEQLKADIKERNATLSD